MILYRIEIYISYKPIPVHQVAQYVVFFCHPLENITQFLNFVKRGLTTFLTDLCYRYEQGAQKQKETKMKTLFENKIGLVLLVGILLSIPLKSAAEADPSPEVLAKFIVTDLYRQNKKCANKVSRICSKFLKPEGGHKHFVDCIFDEVHAKCKASFEAPKDIQFQYRNNRQAATKNYFGKSVLIKGSVIGGLGTVIVLDAADVGYEYSGIITVIDENDTILDSLGVADTIWVSCIGSKPRTEIPRFEECNIVYWKRAN